MERKRTRLRYFSEEEEEEEEEDKGRRSSQRFKKRVRYNEDDEDEEKEEEEEAEEEEVNEHPGSSTQNTSNQRTQENRLLPVTCGNKKGILDVVKLDRGELCIECEGHWISPPAFEDFGGKGQNKKWKTSIFHENKPLQFWFEQGSLTTKGYKRRGTAKHKKILSSDHESESASEVSEIGLQSAEEIEVKDEDWKPGSEGLAPEKLDEEERVESENKGEVVEDEDKMEDQDIPAIADNDSENRVFEAGNLVISAYKKSALQMKLQVLIERLPEARRDCQSNCTEHPVIGIWFAPPDENAQSEEERGHNALAKDDTSVTSATHIDPTQMSDRPIVGDIKEENREQLIKSDTQSVPTSPVSMRVESKSENLGYTTSGHNVAQLQEMEQQKRCPLTVQALDVEEGPSSESTTDFSHDTMDLDQLKRAKVKLQLKVLKLQEEYYTLQIQKFKQ
ncbi:hypothetical protein PAMA_009244 [Pampus argenteus]